MVPLTVYAQKPPEIESQNFTIKTEVQESPETTKLLQELGKRQQVQDERFNQFIDEFNKKELIIPSLEPQWNQGDVLVASATIFAFFGFGSFIVIRFESKSKPILVGITKDVLFSVGGIQFLHLFMIGVIILGVFEPIMYIVVLAGTVFLLISILKLIYRIILIENRDIEQSRKGIDFTDEIVRELGRQSNSHDELTKEIDDLSRENKRLRNELGEY